MNVVAAMAPLRLDDVPWSFLMALGSLGLIYYVFRRRRDVFEDIGFSGKEVVLLTLGSVAGWAVNMPLFVLGGTYLAVNVGGTLVPLLLIAWWVRKGKLRVVPALTGATLVALVTWRIVEFDPRAGIIARYPTFFLPIVVALVFALLVSLRRPATGAPIAYASGTLGALVGADLLHVEDMRAHFIAAEENTIISIGGAGVFDMAFLAGTFAMALHLAVVSVAGRRRERVVAPAAYPPRHAPLGAPADLLRRYRALERPNALERAYANLALSDEALTQGDYARSLRMSRSALDGLTHDANVRAHLATDVPAGLRADLDALRHAADDATAATLKRAGDANHAAKLLVDALAPHARLEQAVEVRA